MSLCQCGQTWRAVQSPFSCIFRGRHVLGLSERLAEAARSTLLYEDWYGAPLRSWSRT